MGGKKRQGKHDEQSDPSELTSEHWSDSPSAPADNELGQEAVTDISEMEDHLPYPEPMKGKVYLTELKALQIELVKCQYWVKAKGIRLAILFEGRDAAGKGGAIFRFRQNLNPRGAPHVALDKPNDHEATQWYFQRYVAHLPSAGEIVFFDRSWYNRAGVERVMGFCTEQEYQQFLAQVTGFERALQGSGIYLLKLWFAVSRHHQKKRIEARRTHALKRWKLSPIDEASLARFDDYTLARDQMLAASDTREAPWTIINSNEKRRARLESIRHVLASLPYHNKDAAVVGVPDPRVVRPASVLNIPRLVDVRSGDE